MGQVKAMIDQKINDRLDQLQQMMETQKHIEDPELVLEHIGTITKFWSILSDEDKDYIECARWAVEENKEWNV